MLTSRIMKSIMVPRNEDTGQGGSHNQAHPAPVHRCRPAVDIFPCVAERGVKTDMRILNNPNFRIRMSVFEGLFIIGFAPKKSNLGPYFEWWPLKY